MSSIKREIKHFRVIVVQWRQKSVQKKRDARVEFLLCLFSCLLVRVREQFNFGHVHYLFT